MKIKLFFLLLNFHLTIFGMEEFAQVKAKTLDKSKKIKSDLIKRYIKSKVSAAAISEKKFKCRYCINGYQYSSNLKSNVQRHEKYHLVSGSCVCDCGCKFQHMGALAKHKLGTHKIK